MTLDEGKKLLSENGISFEMCEFENETAYWHHVAHFPYTKNAKACKVVALIVLSNNEKMNVELQFNAVNHNFLFEDLRFGDYSFEMFDYSDEMLADDLLDRMKEIQSGKFVVIVANDLKNRCWLGDACFDLDDDDDLFGQRGFEKAMKRIHKPKGFLSRLFKTRKLYEIYDWNTYQCITK